MILKIVDIPPEEGLTPTREVWLRNEKHVVLPDWFPQDTLFALSELKTNRLYLSEHRQQIMSSIRQNMGLRRMPFDWVERVSNVVLGLILMVFALSVAAFFASISSAVKANYYTYFCSVVALVVVGMIVFIRFRAMRGTLQPSHTHQVDENIEHLITKGRLIICEAQLTLATKSQPYLCYTLFPEHGRATRMRVPFPEYEYLQFPGKWTGFNILVLYVDHTLNVVL